MVLGPGLACRLVRRLRPRLPLGPAAQASLALVLGPGLACAAWSPRCYLAQAYACCLLAYHTQMGLHMRGILMARGHLGRACGRASKLVRRGAAHRRRAAAAAPEGGWALQAIRPCSCCHVPLGGLAPCTARPCVCVTRPAGFSRHAAAMVPHACVRGTRLRPGVAQGCGRGAGMRACVAHGARVAQACGPTIRACVAHGFDAFP